MTDQLDQILDRFVADLGATIAAGNVLIGDELGFYRALAEAGPMTAGWSPTTRRTPATR